MSAARHFTYVALHPLIQGLLDELPAPGSVWPAAPRARWLKAAAAILDLIYDSEGEIVALRIVLAEPRP